MIKVISLMGFLSIQQFNEEDIIRYIFQIIEYMFEALGALSVAIWDGFWNLVLSWVNMDNAFWITLVLIMIVSVYIILKKGDLI